MSLNTGDMQICCVIVTYGDRFHLLSQVVARVLDMGVTKAVIIDNGSSQQSASQLDNLAVDTPSIRIFRFAKNQGSAGGFKKGLEIAQQEDCAFLWLLDDDNLPEAETIQRLRHHFAHLQAKENETYAFALACMRIDRLEFHRVLQKGIPDAILPPLNGYMGFHLKEILLKLKERVIHSGKKAPMLVKDPMMIRASAYGGLFFHKSLLDKVGLPDESFVLYADDFDFTLRITKQGGQIWLLPDCVVRDIDDSFHMSSSKKLLYHSCLDTSRDTIVYYALRNSIYVNKQYLVTNKIWYIVNRLLFTILITLMGCLRGKFRRLGVVYEAMRHGSAGKLGKNGKYPLTLKAKIYKTNV